MQPRDPVWLEGKDLCSDRDVVSSRELTAAAATLLYAAHIRRVEGSGNAVGRHETAVTRRRPDQGAHRSVLPRSKAAAGFGERERLGVHSPARPRKTPSQLLRQPVRKHHGMSLVRGFGGSAAPRLKHLVVERVEPALEPALERVAAGPGEAEADEPWPAAAGLHGARKGTVLKKKRSGNASDRRCLTCMARQCSSRTASQCAASVWTSASLVIQSLMRRARLRAALNR